MLARILFHTALLAVAFATVVRAEPIAPNRRERPDCDYSKFLLHHQVRFSSFLLLIGLVASIYLVTVLLFPRVPESGGQIALDAHYYKNRRIFFLVNAAG